MAEPRGLQTARSSTRRQSLVVNLRDQHCGQCCLMSSFMTWVVGRNASLANLQILIQNSECWLLYQMVVLPLRETLGSRKNGLAGTSWSSTKRDVKSYVQGQDWGQQALQERNWGSWWALTTQKKTSRLSHALGKIWPAGQGKCFFLFA